MQLFNSQVLITLEAIRGDVRISFAHIVDNREPDVLSPRSSSCLLSESVTSYVQCLVDD